VIDFSTAFLKNTSGRDVSNENSRVGRGKRNSKKKKQVEKRKTFSSSPSNIQGLPNALLKGAGTDKKETRKGAGEKGNRGPQKQAEE